MVKAQAVLAVPPVSMFPDRRLAESAVMVLLVAAAVQVVKLARITPTLRLHTELMAELMVAAADQRFMQLRIVMLPLVL
jgi:hypothetical protein